MVRLFSILTLLSINIISAQEYYQEYCIDVLAENSLDIMSDYTHYHGEYDFRLSMSPVEQIGYHTANDLHEDINNVHQSMQLPVMKGQSVVAEQEIKHFISQYRVDVATVPHPTNHYVSTMQCDCGNCTVEDVLSLDKHLQKLYGATKADGTLFICESCNLATRFEKVFNYHSCSKQR